MLTTKRSIIAAFAQAYILHTEIDISSDDLIKQLVDLEGWIHTQKLVEVDSMGIMEFPDKIELQDFLNSYESKAIIVQSENDRALSVIVDNVIMSLSQEWGAINDQMKFRK